MSVKIEELMSRQVVTAKPEDSIESVKALLAQYKISTIPIVDEEEGVIGIASTGDFVENGNDTHPHDPISSIMTRGVYTVPQYNDTHIAARMMRNHKIHHLVVTQDHEVVGVISSFDLLKLVEEHRYVPKNAPTSGKHKGKRGKHEDS